MSQEVSLSFPSFMLFSSPFLSFPALWLDQLRSHQMLHQSCQEEKELCRAMDGAQEDKTLSCTREQFLFELRRAEARNEP